MLCKCNKCGVIKTVALDKLRSGESKQCNNCKQKETIKRFAESELKDGTKLCGLTQKVRCDSKTGIKGVYLHKGKYTAEIRLKGKKYWVGTFSDIKKAEAARKLAEEELFDPILEKYGRETTRSIHERDGE